MKQMNKLALRFFSALLAFLMPLSLCQTAFAAEAGSLRIGSLEELEDFAKKCSSDEYSKGLDVVLTADIDAGGRAVSIPIFFGTFDGQNHRIYGLELKESASEYGFFSHIESGATVKNLVLEGEIVPNGTQSCIGGIAGVNSGRIENCSFSGVVIASGYVGGIAGKNETEGTVTGCTVTGAVRGTQYTGGIVGQNAGTVIRATNSSAVNTAINDESGFADTEKIESTIYNILKNEKTTENAVTTDTGGIAGYSTGILQSCTNGGSIGYEHVGYNVGGIAGRQNGYMANCINRGSVFGRKDVGGIVGQMAPDITLRFSTDGIDELQGELNTLQSLINKTLDDAQSTSDTVSSRVERISGYADSARESAYAITGQLGDFVDDNVETVNNIMMIAERYIAKAAPIAEDIADAAENLASAISKLRDMMEVLDGTEEYTDEILGYLQNTCEALALACDDLEGAATELEEAFAIIEGGAATPDVSQLRADAAALREAVLSLETTIGRAKEEIGISGSVTPETKEQLKQELFEVLDGCVSVVRDVADVIRNTDFGALRDQNTENIKQIAGHLKNAMHYFASAANNLSAAMNNLEKAISALRELNPQLAEAMEELESAMEYAESASLAFASAFRKAAQWASDLSEENPGCFSGLGPEFDASSDALNASLGGISSELSALNGELSGSSMAMLSDVRAVNNQFMKVMNLFLNVLNSTRDVDYSDVYEDVSEESIQSATRGKVLECINYGGINADRNVGGIAGSMAIEYDLDPEDDLTETGKRSIHFTYQTRAILLSCENYGSVASKKSCAGGVVGRMDLGTVYNCGGYADVSSESGDYIGGVCGLSLSSIRKSFAKCSLSGRKYVGGIVGSGNGVFDCTAVADITDSLQFNGAIAGEITGQYSGNRFVSDTLAGVDRVSFAGKAEQVDYDTVHKDENIPDNFKSFSLKFVSEGKVIKEIKFSYGDSFGSDEYPEIPEKEGYYVRWDKESLENLHFDTTVTAEYVPYVTALASAQEKNSRPVFIVEGNFTSGDRLDAVQKTVAGTENAKESWSIVIPDDGNEQHTVRWLASGEKIEYSVYISYDTGTEKAETERNGSYICFNMKNSGTITIVPEENNQWKLWTIAGGSAAVVIAATVAVICIKRGKSKKKQQPAEAK